MATDVSETHKHLGRARDYVTLDEYESPDEYADQGDTRVVKDLMFPYHVLAPSPMLAGQEIIVEKVARRNDIVYTDELGLQYLSKGEGLRSFYTSDELKAIAAGSPGAAPAAEGEGAMTASAFSELGAHEMTEYLREQQPTVDQTLALVAGDPDAARRLLEAENVATDNDPRTGVVKGVEKIVGEGPGTAAGGEELNATPAAVELMKQNNIDPADVTGTGKEGRIQAPDVEKHMADQAEQET